MLRFKGRRAGSRSGRPTTRSISLLQQRILQRARLSRRRHQPAGEHSVNVSEQINRPIGRRGARGARNRAKAAAIAAVVAVAVIRTAGGIAIAARARPGSAGRLAEIGRGVTAAAIRETTGATRRLRAGVRRTGSAVAEVAAAECGAGAASGRDTATGAGDRRIRAEAAPANCRRRAAIGFIAVGIVTTIDTARSRTIHPRTAFTGPRPIRGRVRRQAARPARRRRTA